MSLRSIDVGLDPFLGDRFVQLPSDILPDEDDLIVETDDPVHLDRVKRYQGTVKSVVAALATDGRTALPPAPVDLDSAALLAWSQDGDRTTTLYRLADGSRYAAIERSERRDVDSRLRILESKAARELYRRLPRQVRWR